MIPMPALQTAIKFSLIGLVSALIGALLAGLALVCVAASGGL
jgi:hypothetical protein